MTDRQSEQTRRACGSCGKRPSEPGYRLCTHCDKLRMNAREAYYDE